MALGVLNNLSAIYAENNLNKTNSSLQTVLQQLSSGSRINSGADDAAGLSLVNGLQANSTALTQSATNATEGVGLLDVADGALSQVTSLLDRAITLATEASNGTLNSTQEAAANDEYTSILSEINNIGSTTTYNQQQVFSGNTVAIYTGDSSAAGSSIDELHISTLSESSVGDTDGKMTYSSGKDNVFINLSTSSKNASESDSLSTGSAGTTSIKVTYLTGTGSSTTTSTATISAGAGTNYANTADGLIEAIDNSGLGLSASFTTATEAGSDAVTAASSVGTETGILITGTNVGATSNIGEIGTLTDSGSGTFSGTLTIGGKNITLGTPSSTDTLADIETTINSGNYGATASVTGSVLTLTSTDSSLQVTGSNLSDSSTSGSLTWAASTSYYSTGITSTVGVYDTSTGETSTSVASMTTDTDGTSGTATTSYSDAAGISLAGTSLLTTAGAKSALIALNTAVSDVAAMDGYIGAQINTLNSLSSVMTTQQENVTSAQNAIQATDYASATSAMSKYEILSQTGIAALAQANSVQQEVTKLLQS
jgi:flagellin